MTREIYMDNAATSFPKAAGVSDAMKRYLDTVGANIGRGSYARSADAAMAVYGVRERLAAAFGCSDPRRVIFTGGCTDALNRAIFGSVGPGSRVLISSLEHNAVLRPLTALGCELIRIPSDPDGTMRLDLLDCDLSDVSLCVCTHASNVCGTVQEIAALSALLLGRVPLVLDAAQTAGHLPIDMDALRLSAVCMPAHKGLRGPQGLGVMLLSGEFAARLRPVLYGGTGSQSDSADMPPFLPDRFEAGTLNLPGIFGLGAAMEQYDPASFHAHEMRMTARFLAALSGLPNVRVLGTGDAARGVGVVSVDFLRQDNGAAAYRLEREFGILTRCGLHCAPEAHKTLGTFPRGTVRFSFSPATTAEEIDLAAAAVAAIG